MQIPVYHEINPQKIDEILGQGIRRDKQGDKTDHVVNKVDEFLDTHLPDGAPADLNRKNVIYAYVSHDDKVIDIKNGELVPTKAFMAKSKQTLLRMMVDAEKCYVSDLDLYDTIKRAMELGEQDSTLENLANQYWQRIIPLYEFQLGAITRPEVMITYNIQPHDIQVMDD
jgi:hypothetical protein